MTTTPSPILIWLPRVLGLLFAAFLSLFALDVFGVSSSFWGTVAALLIHLIPVWCLLLALALAWRWPWVGGLTFAGFGLWYLAFVHRFRWTGDWLGLLLLVAVPISIGLLFLGSWGAAGRHRRPEDKADRDGHRLGQAD